MRIHRLRLRHFCQHRMREFDFSPGLNAVVGPNGSGKSNLVRALRYAFGGDLGGDGVKEDNVCRAAADGTPAVVEADFDHDGLACQVHRDLRSSAADRLTVAGRPDVHGATKVNKALAELLAVNAWTLDELIFVRQGQVFDFLVSRRSDRIEGYQRLLNLDQAERIYDLLGRRLSALPPAESLDGEIDELARELLAVEHDLEQARREQAALPRRLTPQERAALESLLQRERTRQTLAQNLARDREQLALTEGELEQCGVEQVPLRRDLATLDASEPEERAQAEAAARELATWEAYQNSCLVVARCQKRYDDVRQEAVLHQAPRPPHDLLELDGAGARAVDRDRARLAEAKRFLEQYDPAVGRNACPTCGTPGVDLAVYRQQQEDLVRQDTVRLAEIARRLAATQQYRRQREAFERWHAGYVERLAAADRELQSARATVGPERPAPDTEAAAVAMRRHTANRASAATLRQELARLEGRREQLAADRQRLLEACAAQEQDLDALGPPDADPEAARTTLDRDRDAARGHDRLEATTQTLGRHALATRQRLERLRSRSVGARHNAELRAWLGDMRALCHREALPKLIVQRNLAQLQPRVQHFLSFFGRPFRAELSEDLSFVAHFPDGNVERAPRLSGGQLLVLALCFRMAVNARFAADVGLLCLDEPTAGLDQANVTHLGEALDHLRQLASRGGLQVILVTHERRLDRHFDKVIALE